MSTVIAAALAALFFSLWRDEVHGRRYAEWLAAHRERELEETHRNLLWAIEALGDRTIEGDEWKSQ